MEFLAGCIYPTWTKIIGVICKLLPIYSENFMRITVTVFP